jgi:hypothetical protein
LPDEALGEEMRVFHLLDRVGTGQQLLTLEGKALKPPSL